MGDLRSFLMRSVKSLTLLLLTEMVGLSYLDDFMHISWSYTRNMVTISFHRLKFLGDKIYPGFFWIQCDYVKQNMKPWLSPCSALWESGGIWGFLVFLSQDILLNELYASVRIDGNFNGIILIPHWVHNNSLPVSVQHVILYVFLLSPLKKVRFERCTIAWKISREFL